MRNIGISFAPQLKAEVDAYRKKDGQTFSGFVRKALIYYLNALKSTEAK